MENSSSIWIDDVYKKIIDKVSAQVERHGDKIIYIANDGVYDEDKADTDIYWWTNGFWAGILWQIYNATNDKKLKIAAEGVEKKLDAALEGFEGLYHDVGFMWLHTSVANYRLTRNDKSRARGLHAATILAGRYNPVGQFIRAWNDDRPGWMIIDCLMNIPILYWAGEVLDDPRFNAVAMLHADKAINVLLREDGSCNHIAILNPENGELLETPGGQGYAEGSSWSRGQAWAIYGFALSYRHTGEIRYLETAKKVADYFISNVEETGYLPLSDFRAPKDPVLYDTTAGTCAACGLLELCEFVEDTDNKRYRSIALKILKATDDKFCDWDKETDGIVDGGKVSYHEQGYNKIIYGDYFFIEAILRLKDKSFLIW